MASLKRRLPVVLLLVLIVLPVTLTVGLMWFAQSDTWASRTAMVIADATQMQVALEDVALASTSSQLLSSLTLSDGKGEQHFHFDELHVDRIQVHQQQGLRIQSEQWQWQLHDNSDLSVLQMIKHALPYLPLIDLNCESGHVGSLQAAIRLKHAKQKVQITLSGKPNEQTRIDLVKALHVQQFYDQLPAFLFGDSLEIVRLNILFDLKSLRLDWDAQLQWAHGQAQLRFVDDACQVLDFADTRLPLFVVKEKQLQFLGNTFEALYLGFSAHADYLALRLGDGDAAWRMHVQAAGDKMLCRMEEGRVIDLRRMLEAQLPPWLLVHIPDAASIAGCSWHWNEDASLNGHVHVSDNSGAQRIALRADWTLNPDLLLDNVLITHPHLSAVASIDFQEQDIHLRQLSISKSARSLAHMWSVLDATGCFIPRSSKSPLLRVHDKQEKALATFDGQQWQIPHLTAEQCNAWLGFPLSQSGHFTKVLAEDVQGQIQFSAQIHDMMLSWPIANWACTDGVLSYQQGAGKRSWSLSQANSVWQYNVLNDGSAGMWKLSVPLFGQDWYIELSDGQMDMEKR